MDKQKTPRAAGREELDGGQVDELIDATNSQAQANIQATTTPTSKWRAQYKVHPATDVFPIMSDEELAALGADIKANGLTIPVLFWRNGKDRVLIDGRNRLEAMNRVGLDPLEAMTETFTCKDPVTHIISLNIRRRHLTKQQQADLIVAAVKAGADPSPSWRGVTADPVKTAAVEAAREHDISKRTVERAFAKAEGREPKPAAKAPDNYEPKYRPQPKSGNKHLVTIGPTLEHARERYLHKIEERVNIPPLDYNGEPEDWEFDLDEELRFIVGAFKEIAGKRAMAAQDRGTTLPQDGRSEVPVDDPTPENEVDLGNIPECLDRRKRP